MAVSTECKVAVFGATGSQGRSVVDALLASNEFTGKRYAVVAITRDAASPRTRALEQLPQVRVAQADMQNEAEVRAALEGVYAVFSVTDAYQLTMNEYEVGAMVARAAKDAGVRHFVWSTLPNVEQLSQGKWNVPHFTNKAKVEDVVRKLGFEYYTFVEPAFYFQNFWAFKMVDFLEDGTVQFRLPMEEHHMLTGFDVADTGRGVAAALSNPFEWHGKRICLAGYHAPVATWVAEFQALTGRRAVFKTVPSFMSEELTQMFRWFSDFTYYGNHDITTGRKAYPGLKTWSEYLREGKWEEAARAQSRGGG